MTASRARHGATNQQQTTIGVDALDDQILNGAGDVTHLTGHALTREHATRILRHADGTRNAVRTRVTVRGTLGTEVVTFDGAGKAFTLRGTLHVDLLTDHEVIGTQHRASRNFGSTLGRDVEFGSHSTGLDASLGIMTCFSGIDAGCATLAIDELNGRVAVFFDGLDLRDPVTSMTVTGMLSPSSVKIRIIPTFRPRRPKAELA